MTHGRRKAAFASRRWFLAATVSASLLAAVFVWQAAKETTTLSPAVTGNPGTEAPPLSVDAEWETDLEQIAALTGGVTKTVDTWLDTTLTEQRWAYLDQDAIVILETITNGLPFGLASIVPVKCQRAIGHRSTRWTRPDDGPSTTACKRDFPPRCQRRFGEFLPLQLPPDRERCGWTIPKRPPATGFQVPPARRPSRDNSMRRGRLFGPRRATLDHCELAVAGARNHFLGNQPVTIRAQTVGLFAMFEHGMARTWLVVQPRDTDLQVGRQSRPKRQVGRLKRIVVSYRFTAGPNQESGLGYSLTLDTVPRNSRSGNASRRIVTGQRPNLGDLVFVDHGPDLHLPWIGQTDKHPLLQSQLTGLDHVAMPFMMQMGEDNLPRHRCTVHLSICDSISASWSRRIR